MPQHIEPEMVSLFGTIYEKVPAFMIKDADGKEHLHDAFIHPDGTELACFYVQQPIMLSACRLRTVTRLSYQDVNPELFRDFDSRNRLMTPAQVDAYSIFMDGAFARLR